METQGSLLGDDATDSIQIVDLFLPPYTRQGLQSALYFVEYAFMDTPLHVKTRFLQASSGPVVSVLREFSGNERGVL